MKRLFLCAFLLVPTPAAAVEATPISFQVTPGFQVTAASDYTPDIPGKRYDSARWTQSISVLNERDNIAPVRVRDLPDRRWHQPGGLEGITGWKSERYRYVPDGQRVRTFIANIGVRNSFGYIQQNRGLSRLYPDGTRFDEVLLNAQTGKVFEHRVRKKVNGAWKSEVYHRDETQFPAGYTGLKVSCSSCHAEAGTGGYAVGLVPGGDTVLSDPLPWELWQTNSPEGVNERLAPQFSVLPMVKPDPVNFAAPEYELWLIGGQYHHIPKGQAPSFTSGGCVNGNCAPQSERWYPGKRLGR